MSKEDRDTSADPVKSPEVAPQSLLGIATGGNDPDTSTDPVKSPEVAPQSLSDIATGGEGPTSVQRGVVFENPQASE